MNPFGSYWLDSLKQQLISTVKRKQDYSTLKTILIEKLNISEAEIAELIITANPVDADWQAANTIIDACNHN